MSKIWDICTSCAKEVLESENESWRECKRCQRAKYLVISLLFILVITIWVPFLSHGYKPSLFLSDLGLTLDLIGAWFLATGYSDIFAIANGGWGGATNVYKSFGNRHFLKRTIGIVLLGVGFALQARGNWLSSITN